MSILYNIQTSAELVIGSALLEGSIEPLKKPYLIIENSNINNNTGTINNTDKESDQIEYDMIGLIKKKILFKTRPKPLMNMSKA